MIIKPAAWLNLWVQAPLDDPTLLSGSPVSLNISDLLNAWVQWEGLTDLGDWTVPYGSDYAETGLYSARGNALLTCVYGSFTLDDVPRAYYSMQLTWQPYAPTPQPGSTDLLPARARCQKPAIIITLTSSLTSGTMTALPLCLIMMPT